MRVMYLQSTLTISCSTGPTRSDLPCRGCRVALPAWANLTHLALARSCWCAAMARPTYSRVTRSQARVERASEAVAGVLNYWLAVPPDAPAVLSVSRSSETQFRGLCSDCRLRNVYPVADQLRMSLLWLQRFRHQQSDKYQYGVSGTCFITHIGHAKHFAWNIHINSGADVLTYGRETTSNRDPRTSYRGPFPFPFPSWEGRSHRPTSSGYRPASHRVCRAIHGYS